METDTTIETNESLSTRSGSGVDDRRLVSRFRWLPMHLGYFYAFPSLGVTFHRLEPWVYNPDAWKWEIGIQIGWGWKHGEIIIHG
jgi:hypothetical protein